MRNHNLHIQNCYSIVDTKIQLQPFTLVIGPNNSGKSNLLHTLQYWKRNGVIKHFNSPHRETRLNGYVSGTMHPGLKNLLHQVNIYAINPQYVGRYETLTNNPDVEPIGVGVVRVLDSLKTGDREDLFNIIEEKLCHYIPEIEKLSFIPSTNTKALQVREKHIQKPVPVSALSEGTRLVIAILTILYQERLPSLVCIEDIDHGLHPRLLEKIINLCFDLSEQPGRPPIIATTHNPYLVDLFKGREEAVLIAEKKDGATTFTPLSEKMEEVEDDIPLGELWFSGLVGGVPSDA